MKRILTIIDLRQHTIYFLNINTTNNPIYIKRCDIVIKPGNKSLDIDFHVARDLANDLRASVAFASSMSGKQAGQAPELRFDLPLCEIMNNGLISKSTLITNWGKSFFKQGSLPAKCPILAVSRYICQLRKYSCNFTVPSRATILGVI